MRRYDSFPDTYLHTYIHTCRAPYPPSSETSNLRVKGVDQHIRKQNPRESHGAVLQVTGLLSQHCTRPAVHTYIHTYIHTTSRNEHTMNFAGIMGHLKYRDRGTWYIHIYIHTCVHRVRPVEEDVDGGGERHRPQRDEEQVQGAERELQDGAHRNQSAHVHEDVQKLDAHVYTLCKYTEIDTTICIHT